MNDSSYIPVDGGVCAPQGFLGSAVSCGIKKPEATRLDLALIYSTEPCVSAGTFTTNRVQAACVKVSREHLRKGDIRAIVANSGNANACTGARGVEDARGECTRIAGILGLKPCEVAVCSTGVIGLPMPMMRIYPKFPELAEGLSRDKGHEVAQAVMTSDTKEKIIAIEFMVQGRPVRIGACCKGAGMINPCMATMLCFITTDAGISRDVLELCVQSGVKSSFNCITIDGDMSTNDTVLVMANGASGVTLESPEDIYAFQQALAYVMLELAKHIVQDGERVTKFVTVRVTGGRTEDEAKKAAEAVAKSSLVKSSWNGNDPNWGRIIHAVGYCGAKVDEEKIESLLHVVQQFDPPGVGARDLRECLLLQVKRRLAEMSTPALMNAQIILENYFEEFSKKHYEKISKRMRISEEELKEAVDEILKLNPKPGGQISDSSVPGAEKIIPDFNLDIVDGELQLSLNTGDIPELRLNKSYVNMLEDYQKNSNSREKKDVVSFVKYKLNSARSFIDAVQQRNNTLMLTMTAIVQFQKPFFLTGDESKLKPMILRDIADITGLDVSTISRVSNSKYIQTWFGIYSLKQFFSGSMPTSSGEEVSTGELKNVLKEIVDGEDKRKPYTDDELVELMNKKGYQIARRTIAKYRQLLDIPVARLRREV